MRDGRDRRPGAVADVEAGLADLDDGVGSSDGALSRVDTDGDGRPDTVLADDGADLLVLTDLDGDGFADRTVRIGPDGSVVSGGVFHTGDGPAVGHAPAHSAWATWLGHLFGS